MLTDSARRELLVRNPRSRLRDLRIPIVSAEELAADAQLLRANQQAWGSAPLARRVAALESWGKQIAAHSEAIVAAESIDLGLSPHRNHFIRGVLGAINGWCRSASEIVAAHTPSGQSSANPAIKFQTLLRPYPLVGVISPWNVPMVLALTDAIPALLAGCAVLIKPSEFAPRFVEPLQRTVQLVPELAGVLKFIYGDGLTGQQLIDQVDLVCFTGSVKTGRSVLEHCARRFIPAFIELGGKDPVIVTQNSPISRAAKSVLYGAAFHAGQICFSVERIYVHSSILERFVAELVAQAKRVKLNYPSADDGDIGPFVFEKQAGIADSQLADAVAKGATVLCGGPSQTLGGGLYMRPTVLTGVNHGMTIMREETFAPIMPVMSYETKSEAIRLANDSGYGLSAAVIAGDEIEAMAIATHLNAGCISVQDTCLNLYRSRDSAAMGRQLSGLGPSRSGADGLMRFFLKTAVLVNTKDPAGFVSL